MTRDTKTVKLRLDGEANLEPAVGDGLAALRKFADASKRQGDAAGRGFSGAFDSQVAGVGASMTDQAKQVEAAAAKMRRAADAEAEALGQVRIATAVLAELRKSGEKDTAKLTAAQEKLAGAYRKLGRAQEDVSASALELGRVGAQAGAQLAAGFTKSASSGMGAAGPALIAAAVPAAAVAGLAMGGAVVTGFGAGLAGLGAVVALRNQEVRDRFVDVRKDIDAELARISGPWEQTMSEVAGVTERTFDAIAPQLEAAIRPLAPKFSRFAADAGRALEGLAPALEPMSDAFGEILDELGPRLVPMFAEIGDSLGDLAVTVGENADEFATLIELIGDGADVAIDTVDAVAAAGGEYVRYVDSMTEAWRRYLDTSSPIAPLVDLQTQIGGTAVAAEELTRSTEDGSRAWQAQREAIEATTRALAAAQDKAYSLSDANRSSRQAVLDLEQAQKSHLETLKKHGEKSIEARESSLQLEGAYDRVADAAAREAEVLLTGMPDHEKAIRVADAQAEALLGMAIAAGRNAPPELQRLVSSINGSTLAAAAATAQTGQFRTAVVTLPGGRTVTIAVDDQGRPVINRVKADLDSIPRTIRVNVVASYSSTVPGGNRLGSQGVRAAGGAVAPWSTYRVNERGPEVMTVGGREFLMTGDRGGRVTPAHKVGGFSGVVVVEIDGQQLEGRIRTVVEERDRDLRARVGARKWRR